MQVGYGGKPSGVLTIIRLGRGFAGMSGKDVGKDDSICLQILPPQGSFNADQTLHCIPGPCSRQLIIAPVIHPKPMFVIGI